MQHHLSLRRATLVFAALALAGCDADLLLSTDAAQGIDGDVLLGPMCPVMTEGNPCPDQPYATAIVIRDARGKVVTNISSGTDGHFAVGLEPGDYRLSPQVGNPWPRAEEMEVAVERGKWTVVTVHYDTGIR